MVADKLLKILGLTEYDPYQIAKITRASIYEDGYWLSFKETDTFREHTIRGQCGFPDWESPQVYVLKV